MKKNVLKNLALLGLAGTVATGCHLQKKGNNNSGDQNAQGNGSMQEAKEVRMTAAEDRFYSVLPTDSKGKFRDLDHEGREMSMRMSEHGCAGRNSCKGMGGCATTTHECAGHNDCKGQGGCNVKPEKSVKMAAMKLIHKGSK